MKVSSKSAIVNQADLRCWKEEMEVGEEGVKRRRRDWMLGSQRAVSRPGIAQELSCNRFRGSVGEGRLKLVDGEMILFWNEQAARLAGIQLFAFSRRNESPPPLAHTRLGG